METSNRETSRFGTERMAADSANKLSRRFTVVNGHRLPTPPLIASLKWKKKETSRIGTERVAADSTNKFRRGFTLVNGHRLPTPPLIASRKWKKKVLAVPTDIAEEQGEHDDENKGREGDDNKKEKECESKWGRK